MKFVSGLRRRAPEKIGMRIRVVSDDVASGGGFAEEFGMLADVLPDDEERRAHFVTVEEIEELRRHCRIRTVVEGDRELAR